MKTIKFLFYFILLTSLSIGAFWLSYKYNLSREKILIYNAYKAKNYNVILKKYQKLIPKEKNDSIYLRRCFYKAFALENSKRNQEAFKFWVILHKYSSNTIYKMHAIYYLGKNAFNSNNENKALEFFNYPLLNDSKSIFFAKASLYKAKILFNKSELDKASTLIEKIIANPTKYETDQLTLNELKTYLGKINLSRFYSRRITNNSVDYTILPGDMLSTIAKKFNTTVDLIKKTNKLTSPIIRPHNHLKIINSSFNIIVNKTKNILTVYENGKFFKEYNVGTGRDNVTPIGIFKIMTKQINPTWYRHDGKVIPFGTKENLLGTRWMSINYPGYGIHGTWDDKSIGTQSSAGCIRLSNDNVEELFLYIPLFTEVKIIEE